MKTFTSFCLFLLLFCTGSFAQGATIADFVSHVRSETEQVNTLVSIGQLKKAVDRLNDLNRYIEHKVNFELEDQLVKAKQDNPVFKLDLNLDLRRELTSAYWQDKYDRTKRAYQNSLEAMNGLSSMRTLDKQDVAWSYLKTVYNGVKTIKDVVASYGKQEYWGALKNAKEGMDGFIENYKQIEEAHLQGLKTDLREVEMKGLAGRAQRSMDKIEPILSYMKANAEEGDRFKKLLAKANGISDDIRGGKVIKLAFGDPKYTWNSGPFQKEVEQSCKDVKAAYISCDDFKKGFQQTKGEAKQDWQKITNSIKASNDEEQKPQFLQWHQGSWSDFTGVVTPMFKNSYDAQCAQVAVIKETSTTSVDSGNLYAGVRASKPPVDNASSPDTDESSNPYTAVVLKKKSPPSPKVAKKVEAKPKPVKSSPTQIKGSSRDKYWELDSFSNTQKEWIRVDEAPQERHYTHEYRVRYKRNGRTAGFRIYHDPYFQYPKSEMKMDNLAVFHGPNRDFSTDKKTGQVWLSILSFHRANKRVGPKVWFEKDGSARQVRYYLDDSEMSEAEYNRKAQSDQSLPPYDIYKKDLWRNIPKENDITDPPNVIDSSSMAYSQIAIPKQAVKFIKITDRYFSEYYYLPNTYEYVGARSWRWTNTGPSLISETACLGQKYLQRRWDENGNVKEVELGYYESFMDGVIEKHYQRSNEDSSSISQIRPSITPGTNPDPEGVDRVVTDMTLPGGSKLWHVDLLRNTALYYKNHSLTGEIGWYDNEMTNPKSKTIFIANRKALSVKWERNGKLDVVHITGKIIDKSDGIYAYFYPDGRLKKLSNLNDEQQLPPNNKRPDEYLFYQGMAGIPSVDDYNSPNLKHDTGAPPIPQAEQTPIFLAVWGKDVPMQSSSPTVAEAPPVVKENAGEDDNYQQLQRKEFFTLSDQINKKLEAADKAFDRSYWQDNSAPKTTLQTTNPKQESLDLLRSTIPIIERAKYPENVGGLYYMVAIKANYYSGRVFAYNAKQDFFQFAAQLVEKSDQLISKNKYLKEDLADAYCTSAEVWTDLTRKAAWGSHPYNKMACDKKVIEQYERALQIDPNNSKARWMLAKLKAPKKPVPAAIQKFEELDDNTWNEAQTIMVQMQEGILDEPDDIHPVEIAEITLSVGSGSVKIKRSGAEAWEPINGSRTYIFIGDMIKTGSNAKGVSVTYVLDKTFLAIKSDAEVTFRDESTLLISRAGVYVQVNKKGSKFVVVTPEVGIGVRGTQFEVNVRPDKTTETYLYEGVVEARNGRDIAYLVPGQKLTAAKGEDRFQQTDFNSQARLQSYWINLDQQRKQHEQARAGQGQNVKEQAKTPTQAPAPAGSLYAGVKTAPAKTKPKKNIKVKFSYSPHGEFSSVRTQPPFPFGTHVLIARIPVNVTRDTPVAVNWYYNGQPLSSAEHTILASASDFDAHIMTNGEPLNPGLYRVEFLINKRKHAKGQVKLVAPPQLDQEAAAQRYHAALQVLQQALALVENGDLFNAGVKASGAVEDLKKALYNAPNLPDVQAVTEMCMAIMSFTEMIHATDTQQQKSANEWVKRSLAHARRSNQLCQDSQLKVSTNKILMALEAVFPEFQ